MSDGRDDVKRPVIAGLLMAADLCTTGGIGTALSLAGWLAWKAAKAVLPAVGRGIGSAAGAANDYRKQRAQEARLRQIEAEAKRAEEERVRNLPPAPTPMERMAAARA